MEIDQVCPNCGGMGTIPANPPYVGTTPPNLTCPRCGGDGLITLRRRLSREERRFEFICAALTGILAANEHDAMTSKAGLAMDYADAILARLDAENDDDVTPPEKEDAP